ncbi:MAG: MupA/Atu3671 family FMN-dependent luciferase-like monooxygenase, partial [Myxococcota bacterium]
VLRGLKTLLGEPVEAPDLALQVGTQLLPTDAEIERLSALSKELAATEHRFWERFETLAPNELPFTNPIAGVPDYRHQRVTASIGATVAERVAICTAYLARVGQKDRFDVAVTTPSLRALRRDVGDLIAPSMPLRVRLDREGPLSQHVTRTEKELARLERYRGFVQDLISRSPHLREQARTNPALLPVGLTVGRSEPIHGTVLTIAIPEGEEATLELHYDARRLDAAAVRDIEKSLTALSEAERQTPVRRLSLLSSPERQRILEEWNRTKADYPKEATIPRLFEEQVDRTPDRPAITFEGASYSYRELDQRSNRLAAYLRKAGVGPDTLVGVHIERSLDLMVATLGVQKAGGAYLPLDPSYPEERIAFMVEDSKAPVILTQSSVSGRLPKGDARQIHIDADWPAIERESDAREPLPANPAHLAYVIYTSGSTGRPKGVMVEHRNVVNFFCGMDDRIPHDGDDRTWLAVTSLSFDISVLELFWTLTRGFSVVVFRDPDRATQSTVQSAALQNKPLDFGLFYWGNDDGEGPAKYRLLLEGAKFADQHGFNSVWTPERHFHAFGGPYPNPAVTGAAVAAVTKNLDIRAGSCVVPLHHPFRVAEEWAVVDNLSNGRVGLSIASGWQPDDFVLRPENAPPNNKKAMFRDIELIKKLWRGEKVTVDGPKGTPVDVLTQPRPVQKELPVWVTTAGNPETYKMAGAAGANVLTHLLGQSIDQVGEKIAIYRKALEEAGYDPSSRKVTLMLHTFVGASMEDVRATVHQPMKDYLNSAVGLIKAYAWAFPTFTRPEGAKGPMDVDLQTLSEEEVDAILEFAFERYFEDSGLFGTVEKCMERVNQVKAIGVDEIGCLIDFGVPTEQVLEALKPLAEVVAAANRKVEVTAEDHSFAAQVAQHKVSHLQCTPSMARMLCLQDESKAALSTIDHLMVGGEAFPPALARDLAGMKGTVTNMYGPTETTIWSATQLVEGAPETIPIGTPIANTQLYILDADLEPVPVGVSGELYIGGDGVVRGYLDRPELTAERFRESPFGEGRIYHTGDLARYREDGVVEFLGRVDHQVKLRGYRIELGEIETLLNAQPGVIEAAVVAREDTPGDQRLVGYAVVRDELDANAIKAALRDKLPEYMVPAQVVALDALPLTPNGKIDRNAFPPPEKLQQVSEAVYVAPESELQQKVAEVWAETLGREKIGLDDNFFDIGGHSLLVVRMHRTIKERLPQPISITDLYRFPTIRSFTGFLESDGKSETLKKTAARAAMRREMRRRRR